MPDNGVSSWPATDNLDLPSDMDTRSPASAGDGNYVFKQWLERVTGMLRAIYADLNVGKVADFPMGGHKITGLADGSATTDAATWGQVQALVNGLDWTHPAARVVATSNIALSGAQTIDGVAALAGDRVLAAGQTTGSENGLYVVASGAWARATDADTSAEVPPGMAVVVNEGTANADTVWILTTNAPITLGTTALTFAELPTPNSLLAGTGLARSGNTIGIAAGGVTDTQVAAANKDGAAGTASMRTLGTGAAQAAAGNDTRITGAEQTANKGTATGYAHAAAGVNRVMKSGRYYRPTNTSGTGAPGQNYLYLSPLHVPVACTFDRIGVRVAATAALAVVRLGLYLSDASDLPSALLADFGATGPAATIDAHTATGAFELTINQAIAAGRIWLAAVCQLGSPTMAINNAGIEEIACTDLGQALNSVPPNGFYKGSVSGALPDPFVADGSTGQATLVAVRIA